MTDARTGWEEVTGYQNPLIRKDAMTEWASRHGAELLTENETLRAEVSRLTGEIDGISRSDLIERLHDIDQSDGLTYENAADLFFELCPGLKGNAD